MERLYDLNHAGKTIVYLDLSGLTLADKAQFIDLVRRAKDRVRTARPRSLLLLTNVTNAGFDSDVARTMQSYAEHNTPYVKASAVVGVAGIQKVILTAIKTLTKREFYLADSEEQAKDWLARQS